MTTKADRIRKLYAAGFSVQEVARIVGCRDEYVRVCARQRADGRRSEIDKRYDNYLRENGDRLAASDAFTRAYHAERKRGYGIADAHRAGNRAKRQTLIRTARHG